MARRQEGRPEGDGRKRGAVPFDPIPVVVIWEMEIVLSASVWIQPHPAACHFSHFYTRPAEFPFCPEPAFFAWSLEFRHIVLCAFDHSAHRFRELGRHVIEAGDVDAEARTSGMQATAQR